VQPQATGQIIDSAGDCSATWPPSSSNILAFVSRCKGTQTVPTPLRPMISLCFIDKSWSFCWVTREKPSVHHQLNVSLAFHMALGVSHLTRNLELTAASDWALF
jgi:hypothetical protein